MTAFSPYTVVLCFFANSCHDGAGLTVVSQSVQGCRTWLLGFKLELWRIAHESVSVSVSLSVSELL